MPNGQDQQQQNPGWVEKKQPDGSTRYYPDDQTNDQIHRDAGTKIQSLAPSLDINDPKSQEVRQGVWNWLWKPKVSPEAAANFWAHAISGESSEELAQKAGKRIESVNAPRTAKVTSDILGDVTSSFTSPGQIGLTLGSLGEYALDKTGGETALSLSKYLKPLLKMSGYTASATFGLEGLGALLQDRQEGESDDDVLERRLLGGAAFLGTVHATGAGINEALGKMLVRNFGLNEDLASKVAKRVGELEKARGARDTELSSIEGQRDARLDALDAGTRRQIASLEHGLDEQQKAITLAASGRSANFDRLVDGVIQDSKGKMTELQRQQLHTGSRIIQETVQAIREMEGDRDVEGSIKKPFREIGKEIKEPVMNQESAYKLIEGTLGDRGIKISELPAAATRALGKREAATAEQLEGLDVSRLGGDVRTEGRDLSFDDLTRIREDLWQAGDSSKDANVGAALKQSAEKLADIQEKSAEKHDLGPKYRKAKSDYMVFKRGIGSGMMRDWLSAEDVRDQDMIGKVSKLIAADDETSNGQTSRAIRTALKAAGIDTGPLDDIQKQMQEAKEAPGRSKASAAALKRQSDAEARAQRTESRERVNKREIPTVKAAAGEVRGGIEESFKESAKQIEDQLKNKERDIDRYKVIPGYETSELAGKSNEELYRIKLQQMAQQQSGRVPVTGMVMTLYGLLHASAFPFLYGLTRGGLPELVKSPAFQDWMIERAGLKVGTPEANRFRTAVRSLSPVLRRMERTGVPQGTLMLGEQSRKSEQPSDEPPTREEILQQQP